MPSMQELMARLELNETTPANTKTASAAPAPTSTQQIDRVLGEMGLGGTEAVKTAAANQEKTGGNMGSLYEIYQATVGEGAPAAAAVEGATKVAADGSTVPAEGADAESEAFGVRVGHYFNVIAESYAEKCAADLETEAGKGELPLAHLQPSGSMTSAIGKPADPALPQNHSASDGQKASVTTGGHSPYQLKEVALKKAILKRSVAAPVGNIVD